MLINIKSLLTCDQEQKSTIVNNSVVLRTTKQTGGSWPGAAVKYQIQKDVIKALTWIPHAIYQRIDT